MQAKENSFIKELISCIKDFEKYPEMASKPFSTVLKYLVKLILIFTVIVTIISVYDLSKDLNSGITYFKNEIPNFSFTNNKLELETKDVIEIENNTIFSKIIINTNDITDEEKDEYVRNIRNNYTGIAFLKDEFIINAGNGIFEYKYEEFAKNYNIGNITKQTILEYFSGANLTKLYIGISIMLYIYLFMAYLLGAVLDFIILGILGYVTALILKIRIKFIAMIKIAMKALTLPILLNLIYIVIQSLCGFEIKYFEVMYVTVAYIYIIAAILMIKADLIKRGQELKKIIQEEQRVKEQLEGNKEEEKQNKEDNESKENKEKKNKKDSDKKEKEGLGAKPQGENA